MNNSNPDYHIPMIPLTEIDKINRKAAARTGIALGADYNGHRYSIAFRPHSVRGPQWTMHYYYGGAHYVARGSLLTCAREAQRIMTAPNVQRGSEVIVSFREAGLAPETPFEQGMILGAHGFKVKQD